MKNSIKLNTAESIMNVLKNSDISINISNIDIDEFIKLIMHNEYIDYINRFEFLLPNINKSQLAQLVLNKWKDKLNAKMTNNILSYMFKDDMLKYVSLFDKVFSLGNNNAIYKTFLGSSRKGLYGVGYEARAKIFNLALENGTIPYVYNDPHLRIYPGVFINDITENAMASLVNNYTTILTRFSKKPDYKNPAILLYKICGYFGTIGIVCTKEDTIKINIDNDVKLGDTIDIDRY